MILTLLTKVTLRALLKILRLLGQLWPEIEFTLLSLKLLASVLLGKISVTHVIRWLHARAGGLHAVSKTYIIAITINFVDVFSLEKCRSGMLRIAVILPSLLVSLSKVHVFLRLCKRH